MSKRFHPNDAIGSLMGFQVQMAGLHLNEAAREALSGYDFSPAKVTALALIDSNPGCEQSALGRALSINRASAMKLVNKLVERGVVERRPGRDLRSHALHLTLQGERQLKDMIARLRTSEENLLTALTAEERLQLLTLLAKMRKVAPKRGK